MSTVAAKEPASRIVEWEDGSKGFDYKVHHYDREGKLERTTPYSVHFIGETKWFADKNGIYSVDGTQAPDEIKKLIAETIEKQKPIAVLSAAEKLRKHLADLPQQK